MDKSDKQNESNDESSSNTEPKSKMPSYECKICGAPALHSNYGAITCYPCKMFFKRNAIINKKFTCEFTGHCEINMTNRYVCTACRLAKCFANGMQAELIRSLLTKQPITSKNPTTTTELPTTTSNILPITTTEKDQLQLLPTRNLLQLDASILTSNQWTYLSNLISIYDESEILSIAQRCIETYNTIDVNDLTFFKEFFDKIYQTTGIYIRSNNDYCLLSSDERLAFLRNIADNVTCLSLGFCWNQSQIYNCSSFLNICTNSYGENFVRIIQQLSKFIDSDIIIAKLTISLFAFSNNLSLFSSNTIDKPLNTLTIYQIQNNYVEILWKYLFYKYGHYQSIQLFIHLTQCLLIAINTVFTVQNIDKHIQDITSLVEQIELASVLDDVKNINEDKD